MDDFEKLQRARMYIEKLANGIDPITDKEMPQDTILNSVRLSKCFFYVSDILRQIIDNGGINKQVTKSYKNNFYITDKQKKSLDISNSACYMSDMIDKINAATNENNCKKFQHKWLSEWLVLKGIMEEYLDSTNKKRKKATASGESLGLKTEIRSTVHGVYPVTLLDVNAQRFIIDNIDAMISELGFKNYVHIPEYQGSPWSSEHEEMLIDLYKKQVPVYEIAVTLKRTETGIRARLKKIGIIDIRSEAK